MTGSARGGLGRARSIVAVFSLAAVGILQAEPVAVTARVSAIKGTVTCSSTGEGEHQLKTGDTVRSGSVIASTSDAGVLLRPSANSALVVYPSSKVRFDGASVSPGSENVTCTILEGKAWFSVGNSTTVGEGGAAGDAPAPSTNVKITVVTEQGTINGTVGNWTVQHDEGRTMVAVGDGKSVVTIGGAAGAATGGVNGQVEVPKGSVIWLYSRDGTIEAELVNTATGTVTKVGSDGSLGSPTKAGTDLLASSKNALTTPSSSGGTQSLPPTTSGQPSTPQNPDFSNPTPDVPVVSAETP